MIGFTNIDGRGVRGIEQQEDDFLRGKTYSVEWVRDARGRKLGQPVRLDTSAGGEIALTLDAGSQDVTLADVGESANAIGALTVSEAGTVNLDGDVESGGIDIQAYSDPLGTIAPRIITQVKQRPDTKVSVQEMRELSGLLRREGDIGLFVSTGGFTTDAVSEAKSSSRHIEIMDMKRFIELWKAHYSKMSEADKSLLPLREIMLLAPNS